MEEKEENNPLYQIFKLNPLGIITEEIEKPSNIPFLFEYLKDNKKSINNKIKIIDKLIEIIKIKRSICAFFPKYENKSIYIFFFDLYLNEKKSKELKKSIINLIKELSSNIQITKEIYQYIFQKFSMGYRQDKKLLFDINKSPQLFNNYFYDLLNILYSTFEKIDEKKGPRNYFSCFGNNNFIINFNRKNFILGKCLSIILNFKITKNKIITENPELLGKCNLLKIIFKDNKKVLDIQIKYPFFLIINDQIKEYKVKVCPLDEWINLTITIMPNDGNSKIYFFINGENSLLPVKVKNLNFENNDIINSIQFFNNFYGEVTSITMLSINLDDPLNIFSQTLKYFVNLNEGLWKKELLDSFLNFLGGITYKEKKDEGILIGNLCKNVVFIFTPINYNIDQPNIVEDCFGKYNLIINGNIKNHKYQNYQKKLAQICNINTFLPILEMILIYQRQLLNEQNLILYFKIISKIVTSRKNLIYMNLSHFSQLLSLFVEKLPDNSLNEKILNEFDNIGRIILRQSIEIYSSNFFNDILLNEKIIFKFNKELQIKLWNIILNYCFSDKDQIGSFISMKKIAVLLRYYDRNRYNEICCEFHKNMYKKEFIQNMKIMEPTLNERLIHIQKIIDVFILSENPEKIITLYRLLMLDLSPCLMKFILKIFITGLDYKNKNEEWKNKLVLEIINSKYEIIIVNAFSHSLPDVRYEILILMNFIYIRLAKLNKTNEFIAFEKMIKTCLLPQENFLMEKKIENLMNNQDFDAIAEFNKNKSKEDSKNDNNNNLIISEILYNKEIDKQKKEANDENKSKEKNSNVPMRASKSNSIYILASKFDNKNKLNNNNVNKPINENIIGGGKAKMLKEQIEEKIKKQNTKINQQNSDSKKIGKNIIEKNPINNLNINKIINDNKNQQSNNGKEEKAKIRTSTLIITKRKDDTNIDYIDFKEGESIYYNQDNINEELIFRNELFDIYINNLYILFLKWTLGIPITYTISTSSELFSSLKQQKDLPSKNYFITNINILEFIFVLNNDLNNINFTMRCLKNLERLIQFPENSYIVLTNNKILSSMLDIAFKYYNINKNCNCSNLEKEMYKIGKDNLVHTLINSCNYLNNEKNDPPMEQLETLFLWGEKIILTDINNNKKVNSVFDFIFELLIDIISQFEKEFGDKLKNEFKFDFNPMDLKDKYILKNFLTYITYVYNFCFHYTIDPIIKNSDMDAFLSESLNINIPEIFISGMRLDITKGNNMSEYWKDYHLIDYIFNKINYIFKNDYIKKKVFGEINKNNNKEKKINENGLKSDKYNKILFELILNKDKKDLFKKEIFLLCYYEINSNKIEIMIPLIRILSIALICILTVVKDSNNESQFKHWLKEYKNLLKFTILSSTNLSKNTNSTIDIKIYNKIQSICLDIIAAGLCFLNNLLECSTIAKEEIKKYINNIFLLCFVILKYHFDIIKSKKIFSNKLQADLSKCAVVIIFNEFIKDKNNYPFININKLEKTYLNPSFKISDLINENEFYEAFFENKNLKNQLFAKYYSINTYKFIVDKRYELIRTLDDKIDYSYQMNIFNLLPLYEKELLKYSNNSIKNQKKRNNLYIKQKRLLFSWNGFWSNKELFYGDINYNKIKYKVINHYTRSLMRPLISPILDINYYLPHFTQYNKENLFIKNNNNDSIVSYDLIVDIDKILKKPKNEKASNISDKNIDNNFKIDENVKRVSRLLKGNNDSKDNYLKYIYQRSNPKLYEYFKKISNILEEDLEDKSNKQLNSDLDNEDNDIIKENERKDTVQTQRTSSSTIKKENISSFKNNFVNLIYDKESNKIKNEEILNNKEYLVCCLVKPSHHVKGIIYVREKKLNFKIFSDQKKGCDLNGIIDICFSEKDDDYDKERDNCFGSYFNHHPKDKNLYKKSIRFNEIKWVLKRKYFYKNSAIEIFTIKNKSYYFNFKDEETRDIIIDEIIQKIGNCLLIFNDFELSNISSSKNIFNNNKNLIIGYQNNSNPLIIKKCKFKSKKKIKLSRIINQWKNWELSNFELLILLNIFSNRSYNDITQYPVFPWILSNYSDPLITQQIKEFKNEKGIEEKKTIEDYLYRDLSLPMGMLTLTEEGIKRKKNFLSTYKLLKHEEDIKPYIFGCNYSNATYVCNYLIRLFPFTQVCIEIQGEGFDTPRRLFYSIEKTFNNASTQSTDVREIIPEFFYLPEMFLNINNLNLGKLDQDTILKDVITPCENNPYKFISTMRKCLENGNVSNTINNWIDLIFGYKAKGKEAQNAKNIYTEQSYQEDIDLIETKDKDNYLRYVEFGLIPNQLFKSKVFPEKEKIEEIKKYKQIMDNQQNLKIYKCKKNQNNYIKMKDDLLLISITRISQEKIILFYNTNYLIEEKISYSIFDKEYSEEIIEIKKLTQTLNKMSKYYLPNQYNNNKNIKIIHEGKIIIMGGYYDGNVIIIDTGNYNKGFSIIIPFKDESPVTNIHIDKEEQLLFMGNLSGNVRIMEIESKKVEEWKMIYLINDHLNSISSIDSNNELNVWASATIDGYINIYTLPLCKLTKSFKLSMNTNCNYIYICESPLASIIIIYDEDIFLYSINGSKICSQKENGKIINPILIKDFLCNDHLAYIINNKEIFIRSIPDFSIKTRIECDHEIFYLCPGADMKILYAVNKSGDQLDVIMCETKKVLEEK